MQVVLIAVESDYPHKDMDEIRLGSARQLMIIYGLSMVHAECCIVLLVRKIKTYAWYSGEQKVVNAKICVWIAIQRGLVELRFQHSCSCFLMRSESAAGPRL